MEELLKQQTNTTTTHKQPRKKKKTRTITFEDEKLKNIEIDVLQFKNSEIPSLNLPNNEDLIPGSYEGGIKIWECSLDLCNFLPKYVGYFPLENLKVI